MNAARNPFDPAAMAELFNLDVSKMFDLSAFKGMDAGVLMTIHQKNVEALTAAQETAAEGWRELFEKQVSIFEEAVADIRTHVAELSKTGSAAEAAETQAALMKRAYETAMANIDELSEIARKTNADAFAILRARIEAAMKEAVAN